MKQHTLISSILALSLAAGCGGAPEELSAEPASLDPSSSEQALVESAATICPNPATLLTPVTVTASAHDGNVPANTLDGNLSTRWSCSGAGCWLIGDLGAEKSLSGVELAWHLGNVRTSRFEVGLSRDGVQFTPAFSGTSSGRTLQPERSTFTPATARYVKLTVNGNSQNAWASLTELRAVGSEPCTPPPPPPPSGSDAFGTRTIYPTASAGRTWSSKWSTQPRTLRAGQSDPLDPEFQMRGSNHTLQIMGDGTAKSSGDTIRMYVSSPGKTWLNTELTVYARRVSEQSDADGTTGFEFQSRTADGHTSGGTTSEGLPRPCDGHSYGFSFRYDGRALFEKELKHPTYTSQVSRNIWSGGSLPRNQWVGIKVITYNLSGGRVKLELWRDLTDGVDGGRWEKVHEYTDAGGWSISPSVAATCNIPADFRITTPQPIFILRNSNIAEQWYKKVTLREIQPPAL